MASKSSTQTVSRSVLSRWGRPDSTRAKSRFAWKMMFVLAGPFTGSLGPRGGRVPISAARRRVRTQRLRYDVAAPSRSSTAWTIPSPLNQW